MATKRVVRLFCTVLLVASASAARGQIPVGSSETSGRRDALVVGCDYEIVAQRGGVRQHLTGGLIKVNDRWIVLRRVLESRNEYGVPVMSKVPYLNRMFKNVGIGRINENIWIPRDIATVQQRTSDKPVAVATPKDDWPPALPECSVETVKEYRLVALRGEIVAAADDRLTLEHDVEIEETTSVPLLGQVPFVGAAFHNTRRRLVQSRDEVSHADILCVRVANRTAR